MKRFTGSMYPCLLLLVLGQSTVPVFSQDSPSSGGSDTAGTDAPALPLDPRIEAHNRFLRLNDEERFSEAETAAQEVVELTREEFGPESIELVSPLINLATTQMRNEKLEPAELNYRDSITILENFEGMLSERLVNPLTGLGAVYNRLGLYDQAIKTFERAVRINHVNDGFYNFDQFKIYDGLTESYVGLQEAEDANFYQEAQLEIYQRRSGIDDPEIVPGLYKLANWYERTGQVELAMQSYRRADDILRKSGDRKLNPQRVAALEGMAHIFESVGNQSAAASVFKRALEVIDAQEEIDYATRASIQVRLGDLYTRSGKQTTADEHYSTAWRDLSRDDLHIDLRDRFFADPVRVSGRQLSWLAYAPGSRGEAPETLEDGYVLISYTVRSDGRTEDVTVVESEPPGMMDKSLVSTFMRSHFRARRIEGQAVDTNRLLYQLDFRYAKESGKSRSDGPLEYPEDSLESDSEDDDGDRGGRLAYPEKVPD